MYKILVPTVRVATSEKRAELSTPVKKTISEMSKQWPKAQGLEIMSGHTINLLTLKTRLSLIKIEAWYTKLTPSADNNSFPVHEQCYVAFYIKEKTFIIFIFYYFAISCICSQFFSLSSFLFIHILPVEDCSSGSRKLVIF